MQYRYQIQGRNFLVAVFFLNVIAPLPVVFFIKQPTPRPCNGRHLGLHDAQRDGDLLVFVWSVMPEPLPTYNRFQNFLYRRRAGVKPWLHHTGIAIFAINLAIGITVRFTHGHHGHLTGQANVNSWVILGSAVLILVMKLWPLPAKAER
jgi:hypothetical protein